MMPVPGSRWHLLRQPRQPRRLVGYTQRMQRQRLAHQRATLDPDLSDLTTDVADDAVVGRRRRPEDGTLGGIRLQDVDESSVVGRKSCPQWRCSVPRRPPTARCGFAIGTSTVFRKSSFASRSGEIRMASAWPLRMLAVMLGHSSRLVELTSSR